MSINSIYILGSNGEILAFRNYTTENKRKIALDFYQEYLKQQKQGSNYHDSNMDQQQLNHKQSVYPCIKIKDNICAYLQFQDIIFLAVVNQEIPVLQVYSILYLLIEIAKNSFQGQISQDKFKQNFSSLFIMLDHFMDYGQPLVTNKFVLEEVAKPNNVIDKIGDIVIGSNKQQEQNIMVLDKFAMSQNPVNHNPNNQIQVIKNLELENQILFDIIEYYDCQIDKNGKYISENVNGELKVDYKVTNSPEIKIYLQIQNQFDDISLHECFQKPNNNNDNSNNNFDIEEKIQRDKFLTCQPPLGQSSLMFYNINEAQGRLPFEFIHNMTQQKDNLEFNFKVMNRPIRGKHYTVEDLIVRVPLPIQAKVIQQSCSDNNNTQIFEQDSSLIWKIGELKQDSNVKLKVVLQAKEGQNVELNEFNFKACIRFKVNGYSISGTQIEKVTVVRGPESVLKLAKNTSKSGHFEIRLN